MDITNNKNIFFIKKIIVGTSFLSLLLQLNLFSSNVENTVCNLISFLVTSGSVSYLFKVSSIQKLASFCLVFGYIVYYFILPPMITTMENKPLLYNIKDGYFLYMQISLFLILLILIHNLYIKFKLYQFGTFFSNVNNRLFVFNTLTDKQVFIIGYTCLLFLSITAPFRHIGTENVLLKFLEGFTIFTYLPFCLFVPQLFNIKSVIINKIRYKLLLYSYPFFTIVAGIALNHRTEMFYGFANVLLLFFLLFLFGVPRKVNGLKWFKYSLISYFALFLILPRVLISLLVVRESRVEVSPVQLIVNTVNALLDDKSIEKYSSLSISVNGWDERYIDNPIFNRLCNLKYADNSFTSAKFIQKDGGDKLFQIEIDKAIATLPGPLISLLNLTVDKKYANSASGGDFLYFLYTGDQYVLGGFRTGNLIGTSYSIFGWNYFFILILPIFFTFLILDKLVCWKISKEYQNGSLVITNSIQLSFIFGLKVFMLFFHFTSAATGVESFSELFGLFIRGWIELPFLYYLLYKFVNNSLVRGILGV